MKDKNKKYRIQFRNKQILDINRALKYNDIGNTIVYLHFLDNFCIKILFKEKKEKCGGDGTVQKPIRQIK